MTSDERKRLHREKAAPAARQSAASEFVGAADQISPSQLLGRRVITIPPDGGFVLLELRGVNVLDLEERDRNFLEALVKLFDEWTDAIVTRDTPAE